MENNSKLEFDNGYEINLNSEILCEFPRRPLTEEEILYNKIQDYIAITSLIITGILLIYAIYNGIKLFISRKESKEIKKGFRKRILLSILGLFIVFILYSVVSYIIHQVIFDYGII